LKRQIQLITMNNFHFRKAVIAESNTIWKLLQQAIIRRKEDGSEQWQDGYPNLEIIQKDIQKGHGFVLTQEETVVGYCAILINEEPEYAKIIGEWISNEEFVVFHRLAISETFLGKGLAKTIIGFVEEFALKNNIFSVKADTNFDNFTMLHVFEKMGFSFCGEVYFRGSPRKAFEKILTKTE
jgi:GNAT superfamily N-acetyltransferase